MARISLTDVQNLQSEGAAVAAINGNMEVIEDFSEEALTKAGPNTLDSDIDMNSNRIINLPEAVNPTSPVRKQEFDEAVGDLDTLLADLAAAQDGIDDSVAAAAASAAGAAGSAATALAAIDTAEGWADLAERWANEDVDVVVEGGLYSAKHWANAAQQAAQGDFTATADAITFTPAGDIAATNVQAAIQELETDLEALIAVKADSTDLTDQSIDVNFRTLRYDYAFAVAGGGNLNVLFNPGFYYCGGSQTGFPSDHTGVAFLIVQSSDVQDNSVQTLYSGTTANIWTRTYTTGAWSAWTRVLNTSNLQSIAQIKSKAVDGLAYTKTLWDALAPGSMANITGSVTYDFATDINKHYQLTGNITFNNPSNTTPGQSGILVFQQDATGSRTISWGSNWKFPNGLAPTLNTTGGSINVVYYYILNSTNILCSFVRY